MPDLEDEIAYWALLHRATDEMKQKWKHLQTPDGARDQCQAASTAFVELLRSLGWTDCSVEWGLWVNGDVGLIGSGLPGRVVRPAPQPPGD